MLEPRNSVYEVAVCLAIWIADYLETCLLILTCQSENANCPCPRCLTPKNKFHDPSTSHEAVLRTNDWSEKWYNTCKNAIERVNKETGTGIDDEGAEELDELVFNHKAEKKACEEEIENYCKEKSIHLIRVKYHTSDFFCQQK